jgi:hypothetical protein
VLPRLCDPRVDHAGSAKLVLEAGRGVEGAAKVADVLAEQETRSPSRNASARAERTAST